jgi:hypothetical protein
LLDLSFADVDEWLKLQLTAKEGSWRMFGSLKKKISKTLFRRKKKNQIKIKMHWLLWAFALLWDGVYIWGERGVI